MAAPKGKKKRKRAGKRVVVTDNSSRRESEEASEEEDSSKEDSPKKKPIYSSRAARVFLKTPTYADLNEELSNLREDQMRKFGESVFKAYRAKRAKDEENSVVKG